MTPERKAAIRRFEYWDGVVKSYRDEWKLACQERDIAQDEKQKARAEEVKQNAVIK